ncbi:MAG: DUF1847 domain-containing protein [Bilifractor sp.]|jgi:uncharacterized metal-binding protein
MEKREFFCTDCGVRSCIDCDVDHEKGLPKTCVTKRFEEMEKDVKKICQEEENLKIFRGFLGIKGEGVHGGTKTRVEMLIDLLKNIGAKRIGVATCYALLNEARVFSKILRANGFECFGINCKVGTLDKACFGIAPKDDPYPGESSCNPILQAKILNDYHTDYNVVIGLCVGHDALFSKYSEAPVSTLVVKDFALAHNSVAPLHMADSYYKCLLEKKNPSEDE